MALPAIIVGAAVVGGLMSMYGKRREIDAQRDQLKAQARAARKNARLARSSLFGQGNKFGMMAELETGRLARSHAQRIGSMRASIGGSGVVADSGTTWDVVVAQDAENQREMNAFRTQMDSRIQDYFDQGEAQYRSYMNQASAYESNAHQLERGRHESILLAGFSGGASGASTGASLYSAGVNPDWPSFRKGGGTGGGAGGSGGGGGGAY